MPSSAFLLLSKNHSLFSLIFIVSPMIDITMKYYIITITLLCMYGSAGAQQPVIRNLVFEGAGMRGLAYSGAIEQLEAKGLMPQVQRVGGTSAGAITALTLALGYNSKEIEQLIGETNFKKFNNGNWLLAGGMSRLKKYFGWYRHKAFQKWLDKIIARKTGDANITFAQLHQRGVFKELYVTGTCLNKQSTMVFSHENFPDMRIKDAVTISMSVPLYFEAVFMTNAGAIVYHPKQKDTLNIMADGGLLANFPIRLFDSTRYTTNFNGTNEFVINPETLGFRIDREQQVLRDQQDQQLAGFELTSLKQYFAALYTLMMENLNRHHLVAADWERSVAIRDGDVGPRIRKLKVAEVKTLVQNGREATVQWFSQTKK
jgi:NTE family protein